MTKEMINKIQYVLANAGQFTPAYDVACYTLWKTMTAAEQKVLKDLIKEGPLQESDIFFTGSRDKLLSLGLAAPAIVKGNQFYTVATPLGLDVYNIGVN